MRNSDNSLLLLFDKVVSIVIVGFDVGLFVVGILLGSEVGLSVVGIRVVWFGFVVVVGDKVGNTVVGVDVVGDVVVGDDVGNTVVGVNVVGDVVVGMRVVGVNVVGDAAVGVVVGDTVVVDGIVQSLHKNVIDCLRQPTSSHLKLNSCHKLTQCWPISWSGSKSGAGAPFHGYTPPLTSLPKSNGEPSVYL